MELTFAIGKERAESVERRGGGGGGKEGCGLDTGEIEDVHSPNEFEEEGFFGVFLMVSRHKETQCGRHVVVILVIIGVDR